MSSNDVNEYLKTKVLTASPAELRLLLLDGSIRFAEQARMGLVNKDFEQSYWRMCQAICVDASLQGRGFGNRIQFSSWSRLPIDFTSTSFERVMKISEEFGRGQAGRKRQAREPTKRQSRPDQSCCAPFRPML